MTRIPLESYKRGIQLRLTRSNNGHRHDPDYEFLQWVQQDLEKFIKRKVAAEKHLEKQYENDSCVV